MAINNSGSGGAPTAPTGGGNPQVNTNPIDQQLAQQQALQDAIANLGLTVSVTEINDVQGAVAVTNNTATI